MLALCTWTLLGLDKGAGLPGQDPPTLMPPGPPAQDPQLRPGTGFPGQDPPTLTSHRAPSSRPRITPRHRAPWTRPPDSDAPQGPQLKTPSYAQAQGTVNTARL